MSAIQQLMAGFGASAPLVVSEVFSATTYTGTGVAFDVVNGIDLAEKGGMVWDKSTDDLDKPNHRIFDTQRGNYALVPNSTAAQYGESRSYTSNGYNVTSAYESNTPGKKYISWTFRKAPGFFDVVTYTGGGSVSDVVAHSLGATPGLIISKRTDVAGSWGVNYLVGDVGSGGFIGYSLESTAAQRDTGNSISGRVTSTNFQPGYLATAGSSSNDLNTAGGSYVAYIFAHDTGADGVIQCGKYTGNGSATGPAVTLGWEPQFLIVKHSTGTGDWVMYDSARDATNPRTAVLLANSTATESTTGPDIDFTATGFQVKSTSGNVNTSGSTYIYVAIRKP